MNFIKRRHFLQLSGSALAALGLNQLQIQEQAEYYGRVLAKDTRRKLALLVGINDYSPIRKWEPLNGCVNDVELQKLLLTYRFGFNPKDIYTLVDREATREGILEAFEEHLIKQAKPGDVVVFHYSGHGSQVFDPDKDFSDGRNSTLVPINSSLPLGYPNKGGVVKDIMGHTLFLLMSAIKTEYITVVLDSCYSGGGKRGNLILRSRDGDAQLNRLQNPDIQLRASNAEMEYQQQWLSRLGLSKEEFIRQRREGVAKGVVITSAKRNQTASDVIYGKGNNQFGAGLFTYELTRYLWQKTNNESVNNVMVVVSQKTRTNAKKPQEPEFESKPSSNNAQQEIFFSKHQTPAAEAVVKNIRGNLIEMHLGGIDSQSVEILERNSILSLVNAQGEEQGLVELESRQGLIGRGRLLQFKGGESIKPGALLQERVRGIKNDITLRIGLDFSLGNATNEAKQALQKIKRIEALPLQQQGVDYILGKITPGFYKELQLRKISDLPDIDSIGLFSPGLEFVPSSFGSAGETVAAAVNRLRAKFKTLLAARIIKLVLNGSSSRLKVASALQIVDKTNPNQIVVTASTLRGGKPESSSLQRLEQSQAIFSSKNKLQIEVGKQIQFLVENNENRDLYVSILLISPDGDLDVLFPVNLSGEASEALVQTGDILKVPQPQRDRFRLKLKKPLGLAEALIIATPTPLQASLQSLQRVARRKTSTNLNSLRGIPVKVEESDEVIDSFLSDLGETTRSNFIVKPVTGIYQIEMNQIAVMSITFEIVESKISK